MASWQARRSRRRSPPRRPAAPATKTLVSRKRLNPGSARANLAERAGFRRGMIHERSAADADSTASRDLRPPAVLDVLQVRLPRPPVRRPRICCPLDILATSFMNHPGWGVEVARQPHTVRPVTPISCAPSDLHSWTGTTGGVGCRAGSCCSSSMRAQSRCTCSPRASVGWAIWWWRAKTTEEAEQLLRDPRYAVSAAVIPTDLPAASLPGALSVAAALPGRASCLHW